MMRSRCWVFLIAAISGLTEGRAYSLSGLGSFWFDAQLGLMAGGFDSHTTTMPVSIDGRVNPGTSPESIVQRVLRDAGLHPYIEMRTNSVSLGLVDHRAQSSRSFDFWLGGVRITGTGIRAGVGSRGVRIIARGAMPRIDREDASYALAALSEWPAEDLAIAIINDTLAPGNSLGTKLVVRRSERVFLPAPSGLVPAWHMDVVVKGMPYRATANDRELLSFSPLFFDLTATAQVYETNKTDGTLSDLSFTISDNQTGLKNAAFQTDLAYAGQSPATISGGKFNFGASTAQFREANVFAHVNRHLDFLKANGYQPSLRSTIRVRVGECTSDDCSCTPGQACSAKANAYYLPDDSDYNSPSIRIAEGDDINLKDLHFDAGVVGHELGHHVVVATVTEYSRGSEALALHEGLSDFFVMMQQGSPCMGRGICPDGGETCYSAQCLRTADNDIAYGTSDFTPLGPHQRGQVISGMLWDMKEAGVPVSDLVKLVLGAIDLLPSAATFGDFGLALLVADENLYEGANRELIELTSISRGIDKSLRSVSNIDPAVIAEEKAPATNVWGCTAGGSSGSRGGMDLIILVLLAFPALFASRCSSRRQAGVAPDKLDEV